MEYWQEVLEILESMSDEEFYQLLIKSGLENCPFEEPDTDDS